MRLPKRISPDRRHLHSGYIIKGANMKSWVSTARYHDWNMHCNKTIANVTSIFIFKKEGKINLLSSVYPNSDMPTFKKCYLCGLWMFLIVAIDFVAQNHWNLDTSRHNLATKVETTGQRQKHFNLYNETYNTNITQRIVLISVLFLFERLYLFLSNVNGLLFYGNYT